MLQIEIFENRNRSLLLCGGFPVCQRYTRRQKSLLYSFPLSPSSSGQGRHPFKVDIAGSNPAGGTIESEKPVTNLVAGFLLPICRNSNPSGRGAEETRERFPAQHARSGATQRKRAAPAARDIPLGAPTLKCSNPPDVRSDGFVLFAVIRRKVLNAPALDKQLAFFSLRAGFAQHLGSRREHDRI